MKTILVTGGAGFVGSHACKALSRAGYLPVTFDNLERGHERAVKWGPLEQGDLRNEKDLQRVFEARRPWAVMHFAAGVAGPAAALSLPLSPVPSRIRSLRHLYCGAF
jgi:UDP-glucose 4-epimerase